MTQTDEVSFVSRTRRELRRPGADSSDVLTTATLTDTETI